MRRDVLDLLRASTAPLITVIAPSGYGKSTVLAQWAASSEAPVVWLSIEAADQDPVVFMQHLAAVLDELDGRTELRPLVSASLPPATTTTLRVTPALADVPDPFVLVIDHLERLHDVASLDAIAAFAANLPAGCRLAIGSRTEPPLPLARLRAQGQVTEVGVVDLAMDEADARALLAAEDVHLDDAELAALVERTEGWPVGLYLAALAFNARGQKLATGVAFRGDDRLLADYVRSEVLARLPADTLSFLTRTSILERMTGPLCDAVITGSGSQDRLESLERDNLLVIPLDRTRQSYRYHHLFRELLHGELVRREPERVAELHSLAATWFEAAGQPELALAHAQEANDADRAARLTAALTRATYAAGRIATVRRWLTWFEERGLDERYPQVAVNASWMESSAGMPAAAERWAAVAARGTGDVVMPDGSPLESYLALNRANMCPRGIGPMRADAELATAGLAPGSPVRATAMALEGVAAYLDGRADDAVPLWTHAADVAADAGAHVASATVKALDAMVALDGRDEARAVELVDDSMRIVEEGQLEEYGYCALTFAVAARVAIRRGDLAGARREITRAARLRPLLTYAIPWTAIHLVQIGEAYLELADPTGARAVLREIDHIQRLRPDLGIVSARAAELSSRVDTIRHGTAGASSITAAELRLLPFLATHLSFREIGERVHVSRHTVKSQAIAVYRKLGVTSRSEAIERINEIGLLGAGRPPTA
ncbi:MAG: LuxR C-terminal-related transcriptional regulator [Ilumatobacteraceae bacterium]